MVLQAQVLAVMGQTAEAEEITIHIVSEEPRCLECYRLLSAVYSKQEHHEKVRNALVQALSLQSKRECQDEVERGCQSSVGLEEQHAPNDPPASCSQGCEVLRASVCTT